MTTMIDVKKNCFVCGKADMYREIASTNRFGSADLDTRPPQMARSTLRYQIDCCPSCGYCASNIEKGSDVAIQVIKSEVYLKQLTDQTYPELARQFLCSAMILESAQVYNAAGWAAVRAAWACDDVKNVSLIKWWRAVRAAWASDDVKNVSSTKCRQRALALFNQARANQQSFGQGMGVEEAVMVDLLRRSGQFEQAEKVCQIGLEKGPEEVVKKILLFQQLLARKNDMKCYTISDAMPSE